MCKDEQEVKEFCERHNLTEGQFCGRELIKGDLCLEGETRIPEGFNPVVKGSLVLKSVLSVPKTFKPVVGKDLLLPGVTSIHEDFSPVVMRRLDLSGVDTFPKGFRPAVCELYVDCIAAVPVDLHSITERSLGLTGLTSIENVRNL